MIAPPPTQQTPETRIDCHRTRGYNVKPGIHVYEFCPFCGRPVIDGDDDSHQLEITVPPQSSH